ncbi:unnamed protein product [Diabrotica balteata]|uniref:Uncharacterized protein n=1 Tax=Diabrotica balteata TaxID=107213 RepID=A0A9N9SRF4_DIABA|nr:unnamed protein product [Diabrotica balteata]
MEVKLEIKEELEENEQKYVVPQLAINLQECKSETDFVPSESKMEILKELPEQLCKKEKYDTEEKILKCEICFQEFPQKNFELWLNEISKTKHQEYAKRTTDKISEEIVVTYYNCNRSGINQDIKIILIKKKMSNMYLNIMVM